MSLELAAGRAFWFPGVFFGLGFALAWGFSTHLVLSFASVSGAIYFVAYWAGMYGATGLAELFGAPWMASLWGPISGAVGSFLLLQAIAIFRDVGVPVWRPGVVLWGALIGYGIVEGNMALGWSAPRMADLAVSVGGFALWQSVVGVASDAAVRAMPRRGHPEGDFSTRLRAVLAGPTVQLLGLLATLAALLQIVLQ